MADHSSLFGVGFDANTHLERLRAADSFYRIRKDIEKHRTSLAMITPKEFKKKYSTFRARLEDVIKDGPQTGRRKLLQPLLENLTTDGIWDFVLVCVAISDDQCNTLENASFADIFPQLLKGVAGIVTVPSETTIAVLTIINKVCVQIDSHSSNQLLDVMGITRRESAPATFHDSVSRDSSYQGSTKRARLIAPVSEVAGEVESPAIAQLGQKLQDIVEDEVIDPTELLAVQRHIVIQFTAANVHRLEGLLANSPLLKAMKNSRQWRGERSKDGMSVQPYQQRTDCMIALIPGSKSQDFSFMIRVGYWSGWTITEYLQYGNSMEQQASAS